MNRIEMRQRTCETWRMHCLQRQQIKVQDRVGEHNNKEKEAADRFK